ncbi:hypothetical protein H6F50_00810 [Coleofasciculus sp. FACHB-712]|uniref:hypothetical protein n=1 Tax=Cyanophyceae TaxID=3028117 RepID=UPI0016882CA9|nr:MULTISPECIES: hypothetical protein [unclassified Coleofasciculus]MBD1940900.1 hypothetical protein [Coleofasciculus sp. FACHB-712]MBD2087663.1 hypothetical protein [Coleofasciculus sp. FACHB-542]
MDDRNLFILTVYIICVTYVLYRVFKSVDRNQVIVHLDRESLNGQLEAQNLRDRVDIQFKLEKRYQLDRLRELSIQIDNKSAEHSIDVDWDRSSLTDFDGRSRRVIRLTPSMILDLSQRQVYSFIGSGKILKEKITVEDVLQRDLQTDVLKISASLFDPSKLKKLSSPESTLHFSLTLVLHLFRSTSETGNSVTHILSCDFTVKKAPWTDVMRWNPRETTKK